MPKQIYICNECELATCFKIGMAFPELCTTGREKFAPIWKPTAADVVSEMIKEMDKLK